MRNKCGRLIFVTAMVGVLTVSCSASIENAAHHNFTLIGSSACGHAIKASLGIAHEIKCDFIKWNVAIDPAKQNSFTLDANYGKAQPNTPGFYGGGQRITAAGKFETQSSPDKREVYRLKAANPAIDVFLVKLNENLFHLLDTHGTMLVGNGGWSYTLNRNPSLNANTLPSTLTTISKAPQAVFDGRTPCREITSLLGIRIPPETGDCFKIKWRIILNRDPETLAPTTFTMDTTFNRRETIGGRWIEKKVGETVVYTLTPEKDIKPYSLLAADNNHLLFMNGNERPLIGDKDFSYTLNRRQ